MWEQVEQTLNQSMSKVLTRFASLLPGIVALIVALLISVIVAWVLGALLRRFLNSISFDERLSHWGFSSVREWSPFESPTILVTRIVSWMVVVFGFLVGILAFDSDWASEVAGSLVAYLPNLFGAILVLLVGNIAARFLSRSTLIGAVNMNLQYARPLSIAVKWLVIVLSFAMALEHLRIGPRIVEIAFGILFGGIVLALALAIGLGSKDWVSRSLTRTLNTPPAESYDDPVHHL